MQGFQSFTPGSSKKIIFATQTGTIIECHMDDGARKEKYLRAMFQLPSTEQIFGIHYDCVQSHNGVSIQSLIDVWNIYTYILKKKGLKDR